jgi:hypothetical protein
MRVQWPGLEQTRAQNNLCTRRDFARLLGLRRTILRDVGGRAVAVDEGAQLASCRCTLDRSSSHANDGCSRCANWVGALSCGCKTG